VIHDGRFQGWPSWIILSY